MENKKYQIEEIKKYPNDARLTIIGLMIANELNKIHSTLEKLKEK